MELNRSSSQSSVPTLPRSRSSSVSSIASRASSSSSRSSTDTEVEEPVNGMIPPPAKLVGLMKPLTIKNWRNTRVAAAEGSGVAGSLSKYYKFTSAKNINKISQTDDLKQIQKFGDSVSKLLHAVIAALNKAKEKAETRKQKLAFEKDNPDQPSDAEGQSEAKKKKAEERAQKHLRANDEEMNRCDLTLHLIESWQKHLKSALKIWGKWITQKSKAIKTMPDQKE